MIKVEVVKSLGLVSGKIKGDLTKKIAREYFDEVLAAADQNGLKRILTDLREANLKADVLDMKVLSQELSQQEVVGSYRRAVVVREDVKGYKQWENECWNAGIRQVRLFVNEEPAMEWLAE